MKNKPLVALLLGMLLIFGCDAGGGNTPDAGGDTAEDGADTTDAPEPSDAFDAVDTGEPSDTDREADSVDDVAADSTSAPASSIYDLEFPHTGEPPWGLEFELVGISGGTGPNGNLRVGDRPIITFRMVDDAGQPYAPWQLNAVYFGMSGPSEHMTVVYFGLEIGDAKALVEPVWLASSGALGKRVGWSFTFPDPIPATYHLAPNDTDDLGVEDGDWGGLNVVDGSYQVGAWGYLRFATDTDAQRTVGASDTEWVLLGDAMTLQPRETISMAAVDRDGDGTLDGYNGCAQCHGRKLTAHGGTRAGNVNLCMLCHVQGAEDRYSQDDPSTTPGLTIHLPRLIHKLHSGSYLATPYRVNKFPSDLSDPNTPLGYNTKDFSRVGFPAWPAKVGHCAKCHGGAANQDLPNVATRYGCDSCHDAIVWTTGEGHIHPVDNSSMAQFDDKSCGEFGCHHPEAVVTQHLPAALDALLNPGLNVEIVSVQGADASGRFAPGDYPSVEFSLTDDQGNPYENRDAIESLVIKMGGPIDHMMHVLIVEDPADASNPSYNAQSKNWTYTATSAIPTVYPPPLNDTADLGSADGDWGGLPLEPGTYRVSVAAVRTIRDFDMQLYPFPATATYDVLVGTATELDTRSIVAQEKCEVCHSRLWKHEDRRTNLGDCIVCHTSGAEDRYSSEDPTTTPATTIHFPTLIHKIHNGSRLQQEHVVNALAPVGASPPYTPKTWDHLIFPRMDGSSQNCAACHVNDSQEQASGRACGACHDGEPAGAHIALNTDPVLGEACAVCHGPERERSVAAAHDDFPHTR